MPTFKERHPEWLQPKEWFPDFHGNNDITTAINYSVKVAHDFRITLIRELMENHDFDGLELDFMRSQFYFHWDKGLNSAHIMTDFIAEIRGFLDELGARRGKYIELAAKVCTTVIGSKMAGFDVEAWAKRGLVDIIIAGTGGINFDTKGFKEILAGTGVSFFPCLYGDYERIASSDDVMRGIAEVLLLEEPDGIYSFNLYPTQTHRNKLITQIGSLEDASITDRMIYKFNDAILGPPQWEQDGDQAWHIWELAASDIKPVHDVYIQLLERNRHLRRFAPAVVQRINIVVQYPDNK